MKSSTHHTKLKKIFFQKRKMRTNSSGKSLLLNQENFQENFSKVCFADSHEVRDEYKSG